MVSSLVKLVFSDNGNGRNPPERHINNMWVSEEDTEDQETWRQMVNEA